jgi:hypothetical protein
MQEDLHPVCYDIAYLHDKIGRGNANVTSFFNHCTLATNYEIKISIQVQSVIINDFTLP